MTWQMRRGRGLIALGAICVAALAAVIATGAKPGHADPDTPTNNEYAVDADAVTAGIQATIEVPVGSNFTISMVVDNIVDSYSAEQSNVRWNPAVVSYVSHTDYQLGGTLCAGAVGADYLYWGCASPSGFGSSEGITRDITLSCIAPGSSALHLQTDDELGEATGTNFAIAAGVGDPADTGSLFDAAINCATGAEATPATPSSTPTGTPGVTPNTPTPLPAGMEAVALVAGCNPVTTTFRDDTAIQVVASSVEQGILSSLWAFQAGNWLGYSPQFPEVSDLAETDFLNVVFICVGGPGSFVRPTV